MREHMITFMCARPLRQVTHFSRLQTKHCLHVVKDSITPRKHNCLLASRLVNHNIIHLDKQVIIANSDFLKRINGRIQMENTTSTGIHFSALELINM